MEPSADGSSEKKANRGNARMRKSADTDGTPLMPIATGREPGLNTPEELKEIKELLKT